jgi:dCMP deaminase
MKKWDERFIELAKHVAQWSKDPSTKVGAVITDDHRRVVSLGYNGFPRGVVDDPERYETRMVKYKMIVHAEANALTSASKSVGGCTLYATKFPCSECAKLIIQMGIWRVVAPMKLQASNPDPSLERWIEDATYAHQMMSEAAIVIAEF